MPLSIETSSRSRCLIIQLRGALETIDDCREFRASILNALRDGSNVMLVDCRELQSMTVCGRDTVLAASFMTRHRGGDFQLFGVSPTTEKLFNGESPKLLSNCDNELDAAKELVSMYDEEKGNPPFDILEFVREEEGRVAATSPEPA